MTDSLKVAPRFTLPLQMVTETMAILAVKRAGKSNAAVVLAEEMFDAGVPWVAIDPKGDWWGIKAAGSGKAPGLPVAVFGGEHADLPLEPTGGALVANLVVDQRLTCVLDVSEFNSKADQRRFLTDFATTLYKRNREPLHVFCEEADEYIPQRVGQDMTKMVGAFETLVKRGGFRGIGITLVTQRSASLNKDVLTQVGTLFAMRTTGPQDRKAIHDWVDWHDASREMVRELPKLANGEAYVFSPETLQVTQKITFRRRRTFDSGATPEVGKKIRPPATLAEVDLDAIKQAMADTIEKAEASDPKHLKQVIYGLRKEIEGCHREILNLKMTLPEPEVREVKVVTEAQIETVHEAADVLGGLLRDIRDRLMEVEGIEGQVTVSLPSFPRVSTSVAASARTAKPVPPTVGSSPRTTNANGNLNGPQTKILTALAQHGPQEKRSLAILTGYSHKGGAFNNPIGNLRSQGYITGAGVNPIAITEEGLAALGNYEPLPTGRALLEWWMPTLTGPEQKIVEALAHFGPMEKNDLAAATGYAPTGGAFNNPIGHLRTLGVLTPAGVSPIDLAEEMRD